MFPENTVGYIDIFLVLLLLVSNYYLFILLKNIKQLRNAKEEMRQIAKEISHNINRADSAIKGLKALADKKGGVLQNKIDQGEQVLHELEYIYKAADSVAERLGGVPNEAIRATLQDSVKDPSENRKMTDKKANPGSQRQSSHRKKYKTVDKGDAIKTKDRESMSQAERLLAEVLNQKSSQENDQEEETN